MNQIAFLNLGLCIAVAWSCVCRLNMLHHGVDWRPRAMFCALLTGATAHGLGPWLFHDGAGVGATILSASVLAGLLMTANRWRDGAPTGLTAPAEFDAEVRPFSRMHADD